MSRIKQLLYVNCDVRLPETFATSTETFELRPYPSPQCFYMINLWFAVKLTYTCKQLCLPPWLSGPNLLNNL